MHTKFDVTNEKVNENSESKHVNLPQKMKIKKILEGKDIKILSKWEINIHPTYSTSPSSDEKQQSEILIQKLDGKSPIEIFEMFMDEDILSEIVAFSSDDRNVMIKDCQ